MTPQVTSVYFTGLTNTDKALEYARTNMFTAANGERADAKNYVIILTDGASANFNQTVQQATLLKQQNIEILAIGIGASINRPELNGMASDSKHVFEVSSFDALKALRTDIKAAACEGMVSFLYLLIQFSFFSRLLRLQTHSAGSNLPFKRTYEYI